MTIAITAPTGHLGSRLAARLLDAGAQAALVGMGISADVAALFIELDESIGSGLIATPDVGQEEIVTPTSIEAFVRTTLVPALAG